MYTEKSIKKLSVYKYNSTVFGKVFILAGTFQKHNFAFAYGQKVKIHVKIRKKREAGLFTVPTKLNGKYK